MKRFLYWVVQYLPARAITGDHGEPYLERYYLVGFAGLRIYLHRFIASDPDRGLHDHPWNLSISLILSGAYNDIRHDPFQSIRLRRPGHINIIRGTDFHRVILAPGREVWTLFIHGPRSKGWGFIRDGEYIPFSVDAGDYRFKRWWKTAPKGRDLRASRLSERLPDMVRQLGTWANKTFAPDGVYRGSSIVAHLRKEIDELADDPRDMEEVADCVLLLCHLSHQNQGDLYEAIARKFAINQRRRWGKPDANGVIEHVRS